MNLSELKIGLINVVEEGDYQYKQEIPLGLGAIGAFKGFHSDMAEKDHKDFSV